MAHAARGGDAGAAGRETYECLTDQTLLADAMDLITQARGVLELQILRVLVHLRFELADFRADLVRRQQVIVDGLLGNLARRRTTATARSLRSRIEARTFHDIGDLADDRGWRYPVR